MAKSNTNIDIKTRIQPADYRIEVGSDLLIKAGTWAKRALGKNVRRIAIVSNPTVYKLYGDSVNASLVNAGFQVFHFLMNDGERYKSLSSAEKALEHFAANGLKRTDAVLALGGGVVGDLAGFASSIYLRGIEFLQVPTTLLSMVDSSVGGKTGVNSAFGKNTVGAFYQPKGVLVDVSTLETLPEREFTAGLCEMVKHAAISPRALFRATSTLLDSPNRLDSKAQLQAVIGSNIAFKAKIVAGDERESATRTDARSRKILNFGHTLAHALEKATNYRYFRHGEAVGYGILYAVELSKKLALCGERDVKLLYDVVHSVGALPSLADIDPKEVFEAFKFDKKNIAGSLQMVLLRGIGKPVILTGDKIPQKTALQTLEKLFSSRL